MNDNPKCPYCGETMALHLRHGYFSYFCPSCYSEAPIRTTTEEALAAAMKRERPKGEWVHGREIGRQFLGDAIIGIVYEDWHCSDCGCVVEITNKPTYRYCPNCGADMRKEKDNG